MEDFPTLDWEKALVKGLIDKGEANAELSGDGAREKAMANLAEPIAEAIKNGGGNVHWVGSLTVAEINALENPEKDGIYGVKDSGVIVNKDGSRIEVSTNDALVWNGEKWASFIRIDLDGYAKTEDVDAAVKATKINADNINSHVSDRSNPHEVTAEQVGAYTKAETEEVINDAISGEVGGWLGNMTVAEINALSGQKKGDSVTVKDSGIVDPGHVAVSMGDDLMWVASKSIWEKKIVRDKGFVEFEGELRFG